MSRHHTDDIFFSNSISSLSVYKCRFWSCTNSLKAKHISRFITSIAKKLDFPPNKEKTQNKLFSSLIPIYHSKVQIRYWGTYSSSKYLWNFQGIYFESEGPDSFPAWKPIPYELSRQFCRTCCYLKNTTQSIIAEHTYLKGLSQNYNFLFAIKRYVTRNQNCSLKDLLANNF